MRRQTIRDLARDLTDVGLTLCLCGTAIVIVVAWWKP